MKKIITEKELHEVDPDDVKFYRVTIDSCDNKEKIYALLKNIKLLFNFEYCEFSALIGVFHSPFKNHDGPIDLETLPRFERRFEGITGFEEMISYLFSFKRMMLVNTTIYESNYFFDIIECALGYSVLDISVFVKLTGNKEPSYIIKNDYLRDYNMFDIFDESGELTAAYQGLQYAIAVIDKVLGLRSGSKEINKSNRDSKVLVASKANFPDPDIELRPAYAFSLNFKYLTEDKDTWEMKTADELAYDEKYYVDLYNTDSCIRTSMRELDFYKKSVSYSSYTVNGYIDAELIELGMEQSNENITVSMLEQLVMCINSMWYYQLLLECFVNNSRERIIQVEAIVDLEFVNGEILSFKANKDSGNLLYTILDICKVVSEKL